MVNYFRLKEILIALTILSPLFGYARQVANVTMPHVKDRPSIYIMRIKVSPVLDGDVIIDTLWQMIMPIGELIQTQPNSGQPPSKKTEILLRRYLAAG